MNPPASRSHIFETRDPPKPGDPEPLFAFPKRTPDEWAATLRLRDAIRKDPNPLVRDSEVWVSKVYDDPLDKMEHRQRLLQIRRNCFFSLESFVEWLSRMIDAGESDEHTSEYCREYFSHPEVCAYLQRRDRDFFEGYDAFTAGQGVKKGWQLAGRCGLKTFNALRFCLPTALGLHKMKAEELAELPEHVLRSFVSDPSPTKEIAEVVALIERNPTRFPASVLDELANSKKHDFGLATAQERDEWQRRSSVERSSQILDLLLEMKRRVSKIERRLEALGEQR